MRLLKIVLLSAIAVLLFHISSAAAADAPILLVLILILFPDVALWLPRHSA